MEEEVRKCDNAASPAKFDLSMKLFFIEVDHAEDCSYWRFGFIKLITGTPNCLELLGLRMILPISGGDHDERRAKIFSGPHGLKARPSLQKR